LGYQEDEDGLNIHFRWGRQEKLTQFGGKLLGKWPPGKPTIRWGLEK
jgi:hypothetical protein